MDTKFDIKRFNPCRGGREYYESKSSSEAAWNDCGRGNWLLWIAAGLEVDRKLLVKAAALCASTVRHLMTDKRSTDAIDACLRYAAGEIGQREMEAYAEAACDARMDASSARDGRFEAADAAERAARTHEADAYAVSLVAIYVASADILSRASGSGYEARAASLRLSADICREVLTGAVFEKVKRTD
jgi:hypothetical protein